jgi:hypothetical protein
MLNKKFHNKSFADISKSIASRYKGRDFDPIAQRTLDIEMQKLMALNDEVRMKKESTQNPQQFGPGGNLPNPIDDSLLAAQRYQESGFNPYAKSKAGALGVSQFMPETWSALQKQGVVPEYAIPTNPLMAMKAQKYLMDRLYNRFGDVDKALAAYNWGEGNLNKHLKANPDNWKESLPKETSDYLVKVQQWKEKGVSDEGLYKPNRPLVKPNADTQSQSSMYKTPLSMKYGGYHKKYFNGGEKYPLGGPLPEEDVEDPFNTNEHLMNTLGYNPATKQFANSRLVSNFSNALNNVGNWASNMGFNNNASYKTPNLGQETIISREKSVTDMPIDESVSSGIQPQAKQSGIFDQMTPGDKMQLASYIPSAAYNLTQSFKPAENYNPLQNQYGTQAINQLDNLKINMQPIINETNLGFNASRRAMNNSVTGGALAANLSNLSTNRDRAIAQTRVQEQQLNNQYQTQAAGAKLSLGEQDRISAERARQLNITSQATKQQFGAAAATQIGQGLNQVGQGMNAGKLNGIIANLASTKNMYYNSSTGAIDFKKMAADAGVKYPELLAQYGSSEKLAEYLATLSQFK